jgi:hypothetical protein
MAAATEGDARWAGGPGPGALGLEGSDSAVDGGDDGDQVGAGAGLGGGWPVASRLALG